MVLPGAYLSLWQVGDQLPTVTTGMLLVFAIILVALTLFASEAVTVDVTAIGIMVALIVLEPWTQVSPTDGIAGFSNPATITVLAMFILSAGIERTGMIQLLGAKVSSYTRESELKQLGASIGVVSPLSGFINNTAAVAILIPMVTDLAHKGRTSPSKLLLPLSYASMFGGMLTLIGTSTNILASDLSGRLLDQPFSMFEFTQLGAIVIVVGTVYLLTVGRWLTPERIEPTADLTEEFGITEYLTEVVVREASPLVGKTVEEAFDDTDVDVDVVQLIRYGEPFIEPLARKEIRAGDVLVMRTDRGSLLELLDTEELEVMPDVSVTDDELEEVGADETTLTEVIISPSSSLVGQTLASSNFRDRYDATVLAMRRGSQLIRRRMDERRLNAGTTLLLQATPETIDRLSKNRDFIVAQELTRPDFRKSKIPVAIAIVAGVVGLAALGLQDILVTALAGVVAMVVTGCLKPTELYDSVDWNVIFLLAGVIPLGVALERTGGAEFIAALVLLSADFLHPIAVLGVFYLLTAFLTNLISNNASVVLMIPVAVDAALSLGSNPFAFVLAVTFAASTAFMTPIGYQTNLMVYGPGGYRFTDYVRVGGPLQLLLAVVTTLGIAFFWGV